MTNRQKLIYGAAMAAVVFFTGIVLQVGGSLIVNALFAILMGVFAIAAVTLAARLTGRGKR